MPLPDGGPVPWPPEHCTPILEQYQTWAAWWTGDVEQLAGIYSGGGDGTGRDTTGFFASEAGGFKAGVRRAVNVVRRWFWGERPAATQQRTRLHVPIAADIASASADMLFSEPPTVRVDRDPVDQAGEQQTDTVTQERLDLLWGDTTHATLLEAAEICAALGGVYLRLVWGPDRPHPWITAVQPDVAVPEWKWGRLSAVTFWREIGRRGKVVWRHLERHESGLILHGLYEGTADELGRIVPLTDHPATAPLATALANGNEIRTGTDRLTAVYVPNVRPNRVWRTAPEAAYLGRPDIAGTEPLMDALDLTWSSWIRDVDLGKARLIVPQEYMQSNGPGAGASVDLDREVYEPIGAMMAESGDKMQIQEVQFEIRVEQHQQTTDALKAAIVGSAGYSVGTFGDKRDGGQGVTATEVTAELRRSLITRDRKIRYWRPELADLLETWTYVDAVQYRSGITPQRPTVEWPDAVSVDPLQQAQTLRELDTAGAISTEEKVRTRRPDWDDQQVAEEVERIRRDRSAPVEDPGTFTGTPPEPGPNDPPEPEGPPVQE